MLVEEEDEGKEKERKEPKRYGIVYIGVSSPRHLEKENQVIRFC